MGACIWRGRVRHTPSCTGHAPLSAERTPCPHPVLHGRQQRRDGTRRLMLTRPAKLQREDSRHLLQHPSRWQQHATAACSHKLTNGSHCCLPSTCCFQGRQLATQHWTPPWLGCILRQAGKPAYKAAGLNPWLGRILRQAVKSEYKAAALTPDWVAGLGAALVLDGLQQRCHARALRRVAAQQ